jgi:hypothetical protein|uniref:Uncharacterized protein n=1 Tax=Zea mays TaxID=4577 RepID=B6SGG0_MAIZE|nr:hypothetical protein [Zea mays]
MAHARAARVPQNPPQILHRRQSVQPQSSPHRGDCVHAPASRPRVDRPAPTAYIKPRSQHRTPACVPAPAQSGGPCPLHPSEISPSPRSWRRRWRGYVRRRRLQRTPRATVPLQCRALLAPPLPVGVQVAAPGAAQTAAVAAE